MISDERTVRARWQRFFGDAITSGDRGEINAASAAATADAINGGTDATAKAAGRAAAARYRSSSGRMPEPGSRWTPPSRPTTASTTQTATRTSPLIDSMLWPAELATRLFAPPERWGWKVVAPVAAPAESLPAPTSKPLWSEPPPPDTTALRLARSKAVTRMIWRTTVATVLVVAFTSYQIAITQNIALLGPEAQPIYYAVSIAGAVLLALGLLRAIGGIRYAANNIRAFEQPYQAFRAAERDRYQQAVAEWEQTTRRFAVAKADAARIRAEEQAGSSTWQPVIAQARPTRIDVFGGDPRRNGWASLLVTLGTSTVAAGERITVLDLTGQDVGGGLRTVAEAHGASTRHVAIGREQRLDLLRAVAEPDLAGMLGAALTARTEGEDRREDRAFAVDVLERVVEALAEPLTPGRLAAAVRVLSKGSSEEQLSGTEINALIARHLADFDQSEWSGRQIRLLSTQLDALTEVTPGASHLAVPTWSGHTVSVIATPNIGGDLKELVDKVLVEAARRAFDTKTLTGTVVVAGADHLGVASLKSLSEHSLRAGVRLVLMLDHIHGALEGVVGTGGAVCFMKMHNHRDASVAAEFIGRGHRFVVSQLTRQVGKTFTDTGGDSFSANTNSGANQKARLSATPGRTKGLNDSRGHAWTGTRSWSAADNLSTSENSSRVYEFVVEPQEILSMPETAFLLVDNTSSERHVVLADGNPGLCLVAADAASSGPRR